MDEETTRLNEIHRIIASDNDLRLSLCKDALINP